VNIKIVLLSVLNAYLNTRTNTSKGQKCNDKFKQADIWCIKKVLKLAHLCDINALGQKKLKRTEMQGQNGKRIEQR
jgi:hypothetical protein